MEDGTVWWQRYNSPAQQNGWLSEWVQLERVVTWSGLTIAGVAPGRFHLFGRNASGVLTHSEHRGETWVTQWEATGLPMTGSPSAWVGSATWFAVYARWAPNSLGIWAVIDNLDPRWWMLTQDTTYSDPAAAGWLPLRWDEFALDENAKIRRTWGNLPITIATSDTGLEPPSANINAISRRRGSLDLFSDGWHAIWPRDPRVSGQSASRQSR
jgi:hypothetical protein